MHLPDRNRVPLGPSEEAIAVCAYLIWEQEGRPKGRDKEHWIQAEEQLTAAHAHDQWTSVSRSRLWNARAVEHNPAQ